MSVLGRSDLLFCEGEPDSLDINILQRVVSGTRFTIVPARSKYGLASFMDGYAVSRAHSGRRLAFRDRDFDCEPPSTPALIKLPKGHHVYLCHRACIENYLLEPALLHRYWSESQRGPKWAHGPAWSVTKIEAWVKAAAQALIDYQAVRWALAQLKPSPFGSGWPMIRSTWTKGSGHLPDALDRESCVRDACSQVSSYVHETSAVGVPQLRALIADLHVRFSAPAFWSQREYMVWFHGKDLKKMMRRLEPKAISLEHACKWGTSNLDWQRHLDLVELHRLTS